MPPTVLYQPEGPLVLYRMSRMKMLMLKGSEHSSLKPNSSFGFDTARREAGRRVSLVNSPQPLQILHSLLAGQREAAIYRSAKAPV